jgi:SRSO17 transposase
VSVIGHADRARPLRDYCVGLMMPCERKSVDSKMDKIILTEK